MNDQSGKHVCESLLRQSLSTASPQQQLIDRMHSLSRDLGQLARQGGKRQGLQDIRDQLAVLQAPGAAGMHLQVAEQLLSAVLRDKPHLSHDKLRLACDAITLAMVDLRAQSHAANRVA